MFVAVVVNDDGLLKESSGLEFRGFVDRSKGCREFGDTGPVLCRTRCIDPVGMVLINLAYGESKSVS